LEYARRPSLEHHVHRIAPMGARVLINETWYETPTSRKGRTVADPVNRDARAVLVQAPEILTQHIYVTVDAGENNKQRSHRKGIRLLGVGRSSEITR
jgi:hypothetical protein